MSRIIIAIISFSIISIELDGNAQSNTNSVYKTYLVYEFLNKYYSEFFDKDNVIQNIEDYYAETILKFHGEETLNKNDVVQRDISSYADSKIISFDIEILKDDLKVTEYWDLDIANLKLKFKIQKTDNTIKTFESQLRIALDKTTTKIIAIDKDLHYYWDLRYKLNNLSKEKQSKIIGPEPLRKFNQNFGELGNHTKGWKGDNDDPYFSTIRFDKGFLSVAYNSKSYGYYPILLIDKKIIWYVNQDSAGDCVPPYCFDGFDNTYEQEIAGIFEFDYNRNLKVLYYASFVKKLKYGEYDFPEFYKLQSDE